MKMNRNTLWLAVALVAAAAILSYGSLAAAKKHQSQQKDIVDTAKSAGDFNTLVKALQQAELVETLKGEGPYTVFAPTDQAFDQLPEGTLDDLLKPENKDRLRSVLTYHVISGEVTSADVAQIDQAKTVNGKSLDIMTIGDTVMVDGAKVIKPDVQASNGVIHVIDKVLMPR